jgi:uncharacterized BrkB/YihY/UPF0761 family membrane protein
VLGFVMDNNSAAHKAVLNSALRDFPIVGQQLTQSVHPLRGSTIALVIGLVGLLWGSLGLSQAGQLAMAEVWNVPDVERPGFFPRLLRSVGLIGALGLGVLATTLISGFTALASGSVITRLLVPALSTGVNVGLFMLAFRILTVSRIGTRLLIPGAVVGGIGWSILQIVGALLVGHNLRHASQVYGYFASVIGLISWLYLSAQLTLYAAEVNVVKARRLWPRSILQPPLTAADKRTLDDIALQGERRPEQSVRSSWKGGRRSA